MIKDITESGFESGVTLNSATVNLADMSERTIGADIEIAGGASIGDSCYLTFRGEKFVPVVKDPQAVKNNEKVPHVVSVVFLSYVINELKRYWFFQPAIQGTDVIIDTYTYNIGLTLSNFVTLFNRVLSYYYGTEIVMDASGVDMSTHTEAVFIEIDYTTIWDVLQQIYEKYKVRWKITYADDVYTIVLSNTADTISHVFSYGYDGGLTSIERQVQDETIHNKIFGRGVETNVPPFYFHRIPEGDTSGYRSDPDALYELKDIYFDTLRDATFRWYVRGWMQNANRARTWEYPYDPTGTAEHQGDPNFPNGNYFYPQYTDNDVPSTPAALHDDCLAAFHAGQSDVKFNPIEYVKDDTSITRYGELWGKAEPNEDIYPSVKTAIVDYYNDQSDEVQVVTEKESRIDILDDAIRNALVWNAQYGTIQDLDISSEQRGDKYIYTGVIDPSLNEASNGFCSKPFSVEAGMSCTPTFYLAAEFGYLDQQNGYKWVDQTAQAIADGYTLSVDNINSYFYVKNPDTGAYLLDSETNLPKRSPLSIPEGTWQLEFHVKATQVTKLLDSESMYPFWRFRIRACDINLTIGPSGASPYRVFNVWLSNLWNTTKEQGESDTDYVTRVWSDILGTSKEAAVYFVSGDLARSTDYQFKIVAPLIRGVEYDTSKSNGTTQSEWKLTLEKSEAEFQADGKFIPRIGIAPAAGDLLTFVGETVVYPQSVIEKAENDINAYKHKVLDESKDIEPSWNITLDKVRINTLASGETATLYSQLEAGKQLTISSNTLIPDGNHTRSMFIEALTIKWNDDTVNKPDVEITLAKEIRVYSNPIQSLKADIREVEINSVDEQQAETVSERTASRVSIPSIGRAAAKASAPLSVGNVLQSPDFKTGLVEGEGWSIYRDTFGNCVLETDMLNVRKGISAPTIEIDEWKHQGGVQILSAANLRITSITDTGTTLRCFFDTKSGSVINLFHEHDIALCTRTDETTGGTKAYRYEIVAVGETFVEMSKSSHTGDTAAVGDEIIQFGNTSDANRQHAIVIDAASGHERMLFGLNSLSATGDVYYYAGAIQDSNNVERRRWFVGDRDGSRENFIEYAWNPNANSGAGGYVLTVGGDVYVGSGDVSLDTLNYLAASLRDNSSNGLILSNQIAVYSGSGSQAQVQGGINGNSTVSNIASWFGGAMTEEGNGAAKVVFRFDGSGYVASKHISWDASGNCTIDGTVKLGLGNESVSTLLDAVQGALQKSAVTSKGSHVKPVYFDSNSVAQEIDGLNVPGDIQSTSGGVSAFGITNLAVSAGAGGTVTGIILGSGNPYEPVNGLVTLPAYPSYTFATGSVPGAFSVTPSGGSAQTVYINGLGSFAYISSIAFSAITGTVANSQLANSSFSIGNNAVSLGSSHSAADFRGYLGLGAAATYGVGSVASSNTGLVTGGDVYTAINAALTAAMKIEGETTTDIITYPTSNPVTIGGVSVSAYKGMVVFYGSKEFVWVGTSWKELGDEGSFALKTTTITGTGYLTGGGDLSTSKTIDIAQAVKDKIDTAYTNNHTHSNKAVLDGIAGTSGTTYNLDTISSNASLGATAYGWGNHANAGYLLASTAASTYLPLSGGTMDGKVIFNPVDTQQSWYYNSAIELYQDYDASDTYYDAPGITFYWGGYVVNKLFMNRSGEITWDGYSILHSNNYSTYLNGVYAPYNSAGYLPLYGGVLENINGTGINKILQICDPAATSAGTGSAITVGTYENGYYCKIASVNEQGTPNYLNPALVFYTMHDDWQEGTEVERMRISSDGNLCLRANCCTANYGQWAKDIFQIHNASGTSIFKIGATGMDAGLSYVYIGTNAYDEANLRVYPSSIKYGDNLIFHEGNMSLITSPLSPRDFEYGTLVTTDIDYSSSEGDAFFLEIAADTYGSNTSSPLYTSAQGYIYGDTLIAVGMSNLGKEKITSLYAMNVNGNLCFWWPRLGYWQSFRVGVYRSNIGDYRINHVTSITDSAKPQGTKEVVISSNLYNSAFTDDNVASATQLQTTRSIWGQNFNGTADVSGAMSGVTSIDSLAYFDTTNLRYGIGTNSPAYKLHVAGDIYANGGWLRTSGAYGWYSETYGGGIYCDDYTYVKTYGGRSLYTSADVYAGGNVYGNNGVAAGGTISLYTASVGDLGAVTEIKIGGTAQTITNGSVNLPAYPTWNTLTDKPNTFAPSPCTITNYTNISTLTMAGGTDSQFFYIYEDSNINLLTLSVPNEFVTGVWHTILIYNNQGSTLNVKWPTDYMIAADDYNQIPNNKYLFARYMYISDNPVRVVIEFSVMQPIWWW